MRKIVPLAIALVLVLTLSTGVLASGGGTPAPAVPDKQGVTADPELRLRVASLKEEISRLQALHQEAQQLRLQLNQAVRELHRNTQALKEQNRWQALKGILPQLKAARQLTSQARERYDQGQGTLSTFRKAQQAKDPRRAVLAIQEAQRLAQQRIDALQQALQAVTRLNLQLQAALNVGTPAFTPPLPYNPPPNGPDPIM